VAIITVVGTLGGAAVTLFGTWLTQYLTGRREDARREHEREIKKLELEVNRQERRREERLAAYRKFYNSIHTMLYYIGPDKVEDLDPQKRLALFQELSSANSEVELIATPAVKASAIALFQAVESRPEIRQEREQAFVAAVREELGEPAVDVLTDNQK